MCKHVRRGLEEPVNKAGECRICRNASMLKRAGIKVGILTGWDVCAHEVFGAVPRMGMLIRGKAVTDSEDNLPPTVFRHVLSLPFFSCFFFSTGEQGRSLEETAALERLRAIPSSSPPISARKCRTSQISTSRIPKNFRHSVQQMCSAWTLYLPVSCHAPPRRCCAVGASSRQDKQIQSLLW